MKRIEDYLKRGLTADEIAKEYSDFCGKTDCIECKYFETPCRYEFLLDELPNDKTLMELFYEQHPNAPKSATGLPKLCPHQIGYGEFVEHDDDSFECGACWNRLCKDVIEGYEG